MISIYKQEFSKNEGEEKIFRGEVRCLSTDTKPTEVNGKTIENGSQLIEIDTGKIYLYDADSKTWNEV